ncbi:MAG TPA: (2Fe-2S)-binding protein [Clostridia bacterium]|nr:(2Fe-2S)-binding protein [Clostridia bacterium]
MFTQKIKMGVNGKEVSLEIDVRESLLEVLRERLHLTGTKKGCGAGECGVCTVLINGETVNSCIYLAVWADGKEIRTIEGEGTGDQLTPVQKAFVQEGAIQCGYCTPGFVMTATALVEKGENLTREEIKKELAGNMCRCTGYQNILRAVEKALEQNNNS